MLCKAAINIVRRSMCNNARMLYCTTASLKSNLIMCNSNIRQCNVQNNYNLYIVKRFKDSRRKRAANNKDDSDEESDESDNEIDTPVGSKMLTVTCSSIRLDNICKAGFGMSRNKIEEAFYASKIRINGDKVLKKSKEIKEGDEIDIILHRNMDNPEFLIVNRIVILSMSPANVGARVKLSRDKNLLIEDYADPWTP